MDLAGVILDIYDDPKGRILRDKVASIGGMPTKLASSRLLEDEELDRLPDRVFAMVAENHGQTVRKYAMHDEAHLITSVFYFDECKGLLPTETRQKVASNLLIGCGWHDARPPRSLVKEAMGMMDVVGAGANVYGTVQSARELKDNIKGALRPKVGGLMTMLGKAGTAMGVANAVFGVKNGVDGMRGQQLQTEGIQRRIQAGGGYVGGGS